VVYGVGGDGRKGTGTRGRSFRTAGLFHDGDEMSFPPEAMGPQPGGTGELRRTVNPVGASLLEMFRPGDGLKFKFRMVFQKAEDHFLVFHRIEGAGGIGEPPAGTEHRGG